MNFDISQGLPLPLAEELITDGCTVDSIWSEVSEVTGDDCMEFVDKTWFVRDICGNVSFCTQQFWWTTTNDNLCPEDFNIECGDEAIVPDYRPGELINTDPCNASAIYFDSKQIIAGGINPCVEIHHLYYYILHTNGDTSYCEQTIEVAVESEACECVGELCPDDQNFPCNTPWDSIIPEYLPGQVIANNDTEELVFAFYAIDPILNFSTCIGSYSIYYWIIDGAGDSTLCEQTFSQPLVGGNCVCPEDSFEITCPQDYHLECSYDWPNGRPDHNPGEIISVDLESGVQLEFDHYGFTAFDTDACLITQLIHYDIVYADGTIEDCVQVVTWDMDTDDCPCVDDVINPQPELCPENLHFSCALTWEAILPNYAPGELIQANGTGSELRFAYFGNGPKQSSECESWFGVYYYYINAQGDTSICEQQLYKGQNHPSCPCYEEVVCPEDIIYGCEVNWNEVEPQYNVGETIAVNAYGDKLVLALKGWEIGQDISDCIATYIMKYYLIISGDTTLCEQHIYKKLDTDDCPCEIDDITDKSSSVECLEDKHFPCGTDFTVMFPEYEKGELIEVFDDGSTLIFDAYGFDIVVFDCVASRVIKYIKFLADGNQEVCWQTISWNMESEDCPCIDDITSETDACVCPADVIYPCGTPMEEVLPNYEQGEIVQRWEDGCKLIFENYGLDITVWDCLYSTSAIYTLEYADGTTTECVQSISWYGDSESCPCDTLPETTDFSCPVDLHYPCTADFADFWPTYTPGEVISVFPGLGLTILFAEYGFDIVLDITQCIGYGSLTYYVVTDGGDTSECYQQISWDLDNSFCPCIGKFTTLNQYHKYLKSLVAPSQINLKVIEPEKKMNQLQGEIHTFPNPASDRIQIQLPIEIEANHLEVYDVQGKLWMQMEIMENQYSKELEIERMPAGVYLLKVEGPHGQYTRRFTKQ